MVGHPATPYSLCRTQGYEDAPDQGVPTSGEIKMIHRVQEENARISITFIPYPFKCSILCISYTISVNVFHLPAIYHLSDVIYLPVLLTGGTSSSIFRTTNS